VQIGVHDDSDNLYRILKSHIVAILYAKRSNMEEILWSGWNRRWQKMPICAYLKVPLPAKEIFKQSSNQPEDSWFSGSQPNKH
jgi:hypothetical protein